MEPTRLPRPWDSPGKDTGVGCHFLLQYMKVKSESEVAQSCLTLRDPMDCMQPTRLLRPWGFPGKSTGVGCHHLLRHRPVVAIYVMCVLSLSIHTLWVQVCRYIPLRHFLCLLIGTSTFFPIVKLGFQGEMLLLELRHRLAGTVELFMLPDWQGSSKRVSYGCQNTLTLLPLAAD